MSSAALREKGFSLRDPASPPGAGEGGDLRLYRPFLRIRRLPFARRQAEQACERTDQPVGETLRCHGILGDEDRPVGPLGDLIGDPAHEMAGKKLAERPFPRRTQNDQVLIALRLQDLRIGNPTALRRAKARYGGHLGRESVAGPRKGHGGALEALESFLGALGGQETGWENASPECLDGGWGPEEDGSGRGSPKGAGQSSNSSGRD
jgi:hypothetical protein